VRQLHRASGDGSGEAYRAFTVLLDARPALAPRDLLDWVPRRAVPVDQVEPVEKIVRRFFSAAMSIGALSPEAHETLAIAMNRIGGRSNSGEGGEPAERFERRAGSDWRGSAVKQVASARFGVTPAYLRSADELQIKIAQGSKPGEGGQLPAIKVVQHIATLRCAQPGIQLISPPVHHDIYSIEDLAQLMFDLRRLHPAARISVKLVSASGVGLVAAGAAKAGADTILISGHDGGTGASPRGSIKHAGLPWEFGLSEAHHALSEQGLRDRVVLQTDGGLQRGRDIAVAAALGADEFGFGTAALVAIGCVMARQCHLDTCPAGIATQRTDLRQKYAGTPEMAIAFLRAVAEDVRNNLAALGLRALDQLVGRADFLTPRNPRSPAAVDLTSLVQSATRRTPGTTERNAVTSALDDVELPQALGRDGVLVVRGTVRNVDRTVGAALAGRITERFGDAGLPSASVVLRLTGAAGQSLGAFLVPGMEIDLRGEANDYVGKGMRGGTLSIAPPDGASTERGVPVLAGNAVLYGATGGRLFIAGAAGERFAVRNSGASAVVEELGDHGCEYMTAGTVVVLGRAGRNFASGMTGGVVYARCDAGGGAFDAMDRSTPLGADDWRHLESLLTEHWKRTGSTAAAALLGRGAATAALFRRFSPAAAAPIDRTEPAYDDATTPIASAQVVDRERRAGV
jgi:glutamate synthase domain-containing protein 2/glutamate synthase domain-containing protein 3